nr:hypothetical protein [uncultured Cohaesibacter sp.]
MQQKILRRSYKYTIIQFASEKFEGTTIVLNFPNREVEFWNFPRSDNFNPSLARASVSGSLVTSVSYPQKLSYLDRSFGSVEGKRILPASVSADESWATNDSLDVHLARLKEMGWVKTGSQKIPINKDFDSQTYQDLVRSVLIAAEIIKRK